MAGGAMREFATAMRASPTTSGIAPWHRAALPAGLLPMRAERLTACQAIKVSEQYGRGSEPPRWWLVGRDSMASQVTGSAMA